MKRKMLSALSVFALISVLGVTCAFAQEHGVQADIPFAFTVTSSTLPAGNYSLRPLSQNTWLIQNNAGGPAIMAVATPNGSNKEADSAKLVFKRTGDRYFLSQVWCLGQTTAVPASKAERLIERETARNGAKPESVYVLASLR
jgi:hypothetical protein